MMGIVGFDLLRLDGYMAMETEELDGKLYVDTIITDPVIEQCDCDEPDVVKHGKRVVHFRDHPLQRQETYLRIKLKNQIGLLRARPERLGIGDEFRLKTLFKRHPAIEQAVLFKEWFYDIYQCETRAEAEKAYDSWRELLPKELEHPFRKVLSYMREKRWRRLIFNYFDHKYTNAYVEATNNLLDEISRGGRGYDLQTLRAKALLKYGTKRLIDIYDFSIRLNDPDYDKIMNTMVGHGVSLSTFEIDLRAGAFD